jgi:hypothetical protein
MPNAQRPTDAEVDELSARLNDGLKSCRSMVEHYRAMLGGERPAPANDPGEFGSSGADKTE